MCAKGGAFLVLSTVVLIFFWKTYNKISPIQRLNSLNINLVLDYAKLRKCFAVLFFGKPQDMFGDSTK